MKIRIPLTIAHRWDQFCDWGDVDVIGPIRRIDVLIAAGGVFCVGWYGLQYGWMGALQGGALYVLVTMTALFMGPRE
jgi:hypothetical protein